MGNNKYNFGYKKIFKRIYPFFCVHSYKSSFLQFPEYLRMKSYPVKKKRRQ